MSMFRRRLLIYQALMNKSGNIVYPGLIAAWSAKGKTNDDADRAILKDLTGNGHDIILNGFAFSEMSGYGGYNIGEDNGWGAYVNWQKKYDLYEFSHNKIHIKGCKSSWEILKITQASNCVWESFKIKLTRNKPSIKIQYRYIDETGTVRENNYLKDGINIIPKSYNLKEGSNNPSLGIFGFTTFYTDPDFECTIELLPEYPDALVFDGVDDYGICPQINSNLFTGFTFICKRSYVTNPNIGKNTITANCVSTSNNKNIFSFEGFYQTPYISVYSNNTLSVSGILIDYSLQTTFLTPINYNGINFKNGGDNNYNENAKLNIGRLYNGSRYSNIAFYSAYLFDRSLDEQEIKAFIRKYIDPEYLLPSEEIPTPDCYYDFSQGSNDDETRDTIKDLSGNGNDAVAHNFAWSGMSGYGGYSLLIPSVITDRFEYEKVNRKFVFKKALIDGSFIFSPIPSTSVYDDFNISINNIGTRIIRISDSSNETVLKEYNANGIYTIKKEEIADIDIVIKTDYSKNQEMNDLTIEFLPKYPDSLVFDGVDDNISLDAFDSGFKTMFMVCNPRNKSNAFLYEQRKNTELPYDYGLYTYNSVAYNMRNANGTYINGIKNTKVFTKDLNNKKILISVNSELTQLNKPTIGVGITGSYSDMALYKFLGFKEALTEEQIQTVIKKYNLLDGVDEIEVS